MPVFSFRAECRLDVDKFTLAVDQSGIASKVLIHPDAEGFPDVKVEAEFDTTLEQLRAILRNQSDSHVMIQTLRALPLVSNSLERDRAFQ
ncbi:hypothetical protein ACEN2T_17865 [Pseudomonas sp. W22_MBD1_FP4]|uniref:hypothetical protein n=1 Tax=Pseudomonas sp. W22_MBD1_FP4 TaxID=3240272 RepID=UPI003F94FB5F